MDKTKIETVIIQLNNLRDHSKTIGRPHVADAYNKAVDLLVDALSNAPDDSTPIDPEIIREEKCPFCGGAGEFMDTLENSDGPGSSDVYTCKVCRKLFGALPAYPGAEVKS